MPGSHQSKFRAPAMDLSSKALLSALDVLHGRAGFSSAGTSPFFFPCLWVDGIGEIAFPLSEQQALAFTRIAEVAPYGIIARGVGLDLSVFHLAEESIQQIRIAARRSRHFQQPSRRLPNLRAGVGFSLA